jgi:hypothetical protein
MPEKCQKKEKSQELPDLSPEIPKAAFHPIMIFFNSTSVQDLLKQKAMEQRGAFAATE